MIQVGWADLLAGPQKGGRVCVAWLAGGLPGRAQGREGGGQQLAGRTHHSEPTSLGRQRHTRLPACCHAAQTHMLLCPPMHGAPACPLRSVNPRLPLALQISQATYELLSPSLQAEFVARGTIHVKGKGDMLTYVQKLGTVEERPSSSAGPGSGRNSSVGVAARAADAAAA